jgi:precorrin-2 dehydrogenase / sirohydrochlorin ferrochelatase
VIVDLDLNGKQVFIFGGGKEATSKVGSMLTENCKIFVIAERPSDEIIALAKTKKTRLLIARLDQNINLDEYGEAILVMAATDDRELNRRITENAKKNRCYAYCVDDPETSDFSHPSIININDTIQIAISTGGKSPLMARAIRERLERELPKLISQSDILNIRLQEKMRQLAKIKIPDIANRKIFLTGLLENEEIQNDLKNDLFENAFSKAQERLGNYSKSA